MKRLLIFLLFNICPLFLSICAGGNKLEGEYEIVVFYPWPGATPQYFKVFKDNKSNPATTQQGKPSKNGKNL